MMYSYIINNKIEKFYEILKRKSVTKGSFNLKIISFGTF